MPGPWHFLLTRTNLLVDMLDPNGYVLQEISYLLIDELRDRFPVLISVVDVLSLITGFFFCFLIQGAPWQRWRCSTSPEMNACKAS